MKKGSQNSIFVFLLLVILIVLTINQLRSSSKINYVDIKTNKFFSYLQDGEIKTANITVEHGVYSIRGEYKTGKNGYNTNITFEQMEEVTKLMQQGDVNFVVKPEKQPNLFVSMISYIAPLLIIMVIFLFIMQQQAQGGQRLMGHGKSRLKMFKREGKMKKFSDVAGADEEKQELVEVIEFLKNPQKFSELGARIPKGVLLIGPPGTGKTLIARAVAGEAGVPFFSISGSDFVELYVGVGASRVRDLFETAKKHAPAIVFIDEIDAVGRQRGVGIGGGSDEREQTLNQLLVEMDGFGENKGIIIIAATNRVDVLDPALLRPGRFDRQVTVGLPDVKGREEILNVHSDGKPLAKSIDLRAIAQRTPGFSGADLENLLNEAALLAARREKKKIDMKDVDDATDRVIAGAEKSKKVISQKERRIVAYHEAGHTIIGLTLSDTDVVHKVTIIPRGQAGGFAVVLPKEDRYLMTKRELMDRITGLLGGRAAEELTFGEASTGAHNDFERATALARSMVTEYGMSTKLGPQQYVQSKYDAYSARGMSGQRVYSEQIATVIDEEINHIITTCYNEAFQLLEKHNEKLNVIAEALLEVETLDAEQIKSLFETGVLIKRNHDENTEEDLKVNINARSEEAERLEKRKEDTVAKASVTEEVEEQKQQVEIEEEPKEDNEKK